MSQTPADPPVTNPYAPTSETLAHPPAASDAEAFRHAHLKHEASCKSIGTLYIIGAVIIIPIGLLASIGALVAGISDPDFVPVLLMGLFYTGIGALYAALGYGLRKLQNWARIGGAIVSALGLLAIPIGTLISAYFLYLLLSKKGRTVYTEEYRNVVAQTPHIKYKTPVVVWILLIALIALLGSAIIFGARM